MEGGWRLSNLAVHLQARKTNTHRPIKIKTHLPGVCHTRPVYQYTGQPSVCVRACVGECAGLGGGSQQQNRGSQAVSRRPFTKHRIHTHQVCLLLTIETQKKGLGAKKRG